MTAGGRDERSPARRNAIAALRFVLVLLALACTLAGCGGARADPQPAAHVGDKAIAAGVVDHWMSVLVGKGSNGKEPGPPVPAPPRYAACAAAYRARSGAAVSEAQAKAHCEYEYERFKLKALYVLIGHQWVTGEAAQLGVSVDRRELARQLRTFEEAVAPSRAAFRRELGFWRARPADVLLSLEDEQLATRIQAKVEAAGRTPSQRSAAFARFGRAFKRKWIARTSCAKDYVVPICRNFRPPKEPAALVPPSVPLTDMPAGE